VAERPRTAGGLGCGALRPDRLVAPNRWIGSPSRLS